MDSISLTPPRPLTNQTEETPPPHSTTSTTGTAASVPIGPVTAEQDLANRTGAIKAQLTRVFEPHINGANRQAFEALIDDRSRTLANDGETTQSVDAVLTKGSRLDRASHDTVGFLRSVPFGAASIALDFAPAVTGNGSITAPLALSAIAGLVSSASDTVGNGLIKRATSDTQWLVAENADLEPVMQEAAKAVKPSLTTQAAEGSMTFQTFTARNVLRTVVQPVVTKTVDAQTGSKVDSVIAAIGSPLSGMAAYDLQHSIDKSKHRVGPEYLLGRQDWHQRFKDLKDYGVGGAALGIAKRVGRLPLDIARDGSKSLQALVTPTGLVSGIGALAGGITAIGMAQTAAVNAARQAGISPAGVAAVGKATVTATMAPVVAAWVTTGVLTQPLADKASAALDRLTGPAGHLDEQQGLLPLVEMPEAEPVQGEGSDGDRFVSARSNLNAAERMV
ncbi:type III effector protein RopAA [Pseudomonas sp. SWRI196]|uniref:Type III effector protein RopAA n=1 Tax=Pseudomonas tehranensis TaxID=2745502 RepID=A0ABR6UY06_9PSED|nr:type III effector protein RopAA [Pseudomonas tehranensis]MBC3349510.1 type III effector protein RopAA [Pseudomonas tehranensis]